MLLSDLHHLFSQLYPVWKWNDVSFRKVAQHLMIEINKADM